MLATRFLCALPDKPGEHGLSNSLFLAQGLGRHVYRHLHDIYYEAIRLVRNAVHGDQGRSWRLGVGPDRASNTRTWIRLCGLRQLWTTRELTRSFIHSLRGLVVSHRFLTIYDMLWYERRYNIWGIFVSIHHGVSGMSHTTFNCSYIIVMTIYDDDIANFTPLVS